VPVLQAFIEGKTVNKSQLIDKLSTRFEGNKKQAAHALESVLDTITREVARGEKVAITGFGSFERKVRKAGTARNPSTGETIRTKKKNVPKFTPGQDLKNVVSGAKKLPKLGVSAASASAKKATSTAKKATSTAKKAPAKSASAAKKSAPAKKAGSTAKKSTSTAKKAPAKSASAAKKSAPAKKAGSTAKKSTSTAKKAPAKSASAAKKSAPAKKATSTAKKAPAKKAPAKKTAKKS
jgi:DNA-binding protein HU-beta